MAPTKVRNKLAISMLIDPEDLEPLAARAAKEGFARETQHGIGRMFNKMAKDLAERERKKNLNSIGGQNG